MCTYYNADSPNVIPRQTIKYTGFGTRVLKATPTVTRIDPAMRILRTLVFLSPTFITTAPGETDQELHRFDQSIDFISFF